MEQCHLLSQPVCVCVYGYHETEIKVHDNTQLCTYILKFSTLFKTKILKMLLSFSGTNLPSEQNKELTEGEGFCLVLCPLLPVSSTLHLNKYWLRFLSWRLRQKAQMQEAFWKPLKWRHMLWLVMAKQVFLETSRSLSPTGSSDHGAGVTCCLLFRFHRIGAQGNNFRSRLIKYETLLLGSRMRSKEGVWSSTHAWGWYCFPDFFLLPTLTWNLSFPSPYTNDHIIVLFP